MRNKKALLFILSTPLVLCSCQGKVPLTFKEVTFIDSKETRVDTDTDIYYQKKEITPLNVPSIDGVTIINNTHTFSDLNDVAHAYDNYQNLISYNKENINQTIKQKLLVVPVYFTDSEVNGNEKLMEQKRTLIQNAFFGDTNRTYYDSVAGYYNKSSYGHLQLEGEVTSWFEIGKSSAEAKQQAGNKPENYSDKIAQEVADWLSEDMFNKYSTIKNGTLDSLYIVYDFPYEEKNDSDNKTPLFWAYVNHVKNISKVSSYAWSSFYFTGERALKTHKVETHTYIHETGHLLGLSDYYNKSGAYQPLGFMDMMDSNLGDHSVLSKYLLNWVSPKILKVGEIANKGSITIRPFVTSGDCILIPTYNANGTVFDRYLLIEYFAPIGLNDLKKFPNYLYTDEDNQEHIFKYPNQYGIRVYSVDARLGYIEHNTIKVEPAKYTVDQTPPSGKYDIGFYRDNKTDNGVDAPFYALLESGKEQTFVHGMNATNNTLFKLNSTFGIEMYQALAVEYGITFKVTKMTTKEARIEFKAV
ncbi:MAG: hypothetical protein K6C32_01090 [Bacilli bacterium]|nr:hypothetical protein [Bacilli bacterium]